MCKTKRICNSDELELLINSTPNGQVCVLDAKEYYLTRQVVIKYKKDITIDGSKAVIVSKYVNNADYKESTNAFLLKGCQRVTLSNITMETDVPCNITATVKSIDFDENTLILQVDEEFTVNGDEVLMAFNTIDEDGSPDYHMNSYARHPDDDNITTLVFGEILLAHTYSSARYDYLGDNTFKVYFKRLNENLSVGERMCIRHTMYGPGAIILSDSDDTVLKNITMHSAAGMGVVVLPRCKNLTIDSLKMVVKEGSKSLMAGNCDGIHITGLLGNLVMKNCVFDGMGDDALNIHATAGTLTELLDDSSIKCGYCKKSPDGTLPKRWCEAGDIIKIYDPVLLTNTGSLRVVSFADGILKFDQLSGTYKKGDTLQNTTFTPSLEIDNCIVRNTRSRAFVIQTENVEIKNCTFFGMSSDAIKAAPDLDVWYEVGPTCNLNIHNNVIEKCAFARESTSVIRVSTNHRNGDETISHLHKNIIIKDNVIKNSRAECITIMATDGVTITGNRFEKRKQKEAEPISLINCNDVKIENNIDV